MTSTGTTERPAEPRRRPLRQTIAELVGGDNPLPAALLYLAALTLAEILTVLLVVHVGIVLHLSILALLMLHTAATWDRPRHRFLMVLAFVPLIRVISMSLPLVGFPLVYWYLITSIPLFVAAFVVMRLLDLPWRDLGLATGGLRGIVVQLLIGVTGIGLGYVEYLILRPEPLAESFSLQAIWLPALILLISTGYLEELIFRRIMQHTAVEELGRWPGIIYVATFFAVLHIGYNSLPDVLFVFAVGVAFGWIVYRTGSLVGVSLSHGLTNIVLFLVVPFWLSGNQTPLLPVADLSAEGGVAVATASPSATSSLLATSTGAAPSPAAMSVAPSTVTTTAPSTVIAATERQETPAAATTTATAAATPTPLPTATATPGATVTPSPTATSSVTPAPSATATLTPSATGTSAPATSVGGIVEYVVEPGDYMLQLAREYNTTTEAIQELNGLTPASIIHPGDRLLIPIGTTPTPDPTATLAAGTTISYVVQPGDYLFALAREFNSTVEAIVEANDLENSWQITAGETLHIPVAPFATPTLQFSP